MHSWHMVFQVALWEFRRFYRVRDQILSLALSFVAGLLGFGVQWLVLTSGEIKVAVINSDALPRIVLEPTSRIRLSLQDSADEEDLRVAVGRRELDGLLILHGTQKADLVVAKDPVWIKELQTALSAARVQSRLKDTAIDEAQIQEAFAPLPVDVIYHTAGRKATSRAEKWAGAAFVGLTTLGVFLGMASFFSGITGEKQLRVTEQVVAAISPQTWIDGKLLGLTAAAFGSLLTYGMALCIFLGLLRLAGVEYTMPVTAIRPGNLLVFGILAVLGIFFWNCFFAAVAVTINDPNSSSRSSLMFLPVLFVGMGFPGLQTPDSPVMRILALMPGTSSTVLTARIVLSEVQPWEAMLSVTFLIAAISLLRRAAGKIFAAGIMMTGKELTFKEVWQCLRQA
ncbi:MAG TPA: ABC transporter permease [Gemmataceae bacterium]|nr:ABC transporter permease [Gemmataceae bacterium]